MRTKFVTRPGFSRAKLSATGHPVECAKSVKSLVIPKCEHNAFTSDVKDLMLSLLSGFVGDWPWPSRSKV